MGVSIFRIGLNRPDLGCWQLTLMTAVNLVIRASEHFEPDRVK